MAYKFEEGKEAIIHAIVDKVHQRMQDTQGVLCAEFAQQLLQTMAIEDLKEWESENLYGAMINFWSLIYQRAPNETKIRIYNPDFERHGWQTTHTVVEIITNEIPFLVDSLRMVIDRMDITSHLIIHTGGLSLKRGKDNQVTAILSSTNPTNDSILEAPILIEIDRQTNPYVLEELHRNFEKVLEDNRIVVEDWLPMRQKICETIEELELLKNSRLEPAKIVETQASLKWIENHHCTLLGFRDYDLVEKSGTLILEPVVESGLGVLRAELSKSSVRNIDDMTPEAREITLSDQIMVIGKTDTEATVHRKTITDKIVVKRFNKQGNPVGERHIICLLTSAAYNTNPKYIPFLKHKVEQVMSNSHLNPRSHAGKILLNILDTLPRDDLIQASEEELLELAMGIYYMQDRRRIRMFARMDVYRRFVSCLVYVPKERFNTELRLAMQNVLKQRFNAQEINFSTWFSESLLARIHFIIRIHPEDNLQIDFKEIEQELIEVGRYWNDDLQQFLHEIFGEEQANRLYMQYKSAFPSAYCDNFTARTAVYDIKHIEAITVEDPLVINFYRPLDEIDNNFRLKIYQHGNTIPLSDVLPIIERLGMRAISERPYVLKFEDGKITWINDFALQAINPSQFEINDIKDLFQNAFASVWFNRAENDGFNQLVLASGLNWRQVLILRTYAKYFKQIGFTFSQDYIEKALINNAAIAKKLVNLFEVKFNPDNDVEREKMYLQEKEMILAAVEEVANLDEDRIIRQYVEVIKATLRTNFYQTDVTGQSKNTISIKLSSNAIAGIPKPAPMFEIFVYSPRMEGVHLRGGAVARGGIRWSDRKEDYRTEVLSLMKAQQVKNAIIVPNGAKGGFVLKQLSLTASREESLEEAIICYQQFIKSLLDITDNYHQGKIVKPNHAVCFDEDDPYLVVAADKGTATFSDIANAISMEYNFWLGDAFASGGSVGYDHKKMGITARGAWESVKRHFYELNQDIEHQDFTVVGIGDMSGDVFGNGMLLSSHIKLVAAFNHQHIFIDPTPNAALSFKERERLFNLPRSSWTDYNRKLISKGGGVFNRTAKSIVVTKEMKRLLGTEQASVEPNELIQIILKAEVDLLWSAGIGTFVKAQTETHADAGDKTNDTTRINAKQLRCRVVGEGGNLGFTQLARIEYSLNGGLIYTDFIDNSGGVNCSDKEVNIKILLNQVIASGDLTLKQRNELLAEMTDEVATLVLKDNYDQTLAISVTAAHALSSVELHSRYINELERIGKLDRTLEFLPDEKILMERKLMGKGLSSPSIAVLVCYSKTLLKEQILASNVPEDPFLAKILISAFPKPLQRKYSHQMESHPLRREIIATKLSNIIINEMGFTFIYRMTDETGAATEEIVRAYMIARSILDIEQIFSKIESLGTTISAENQSELLTLYVRLLRRVTRWFLRNQRLKLDINKSVELFVPKIKQLKQAIPSFLGETQRSQYSSYYNRYIEDMNLSKELAHELTATRSLFSAMDIVEVACQLDIEVLFVAEVYFGIGEFLDLTWIRTQIIAHPAESHWDSLSREALRDDLDWQQRQLTVGIIHLDNKQKDFLKAFNAWTDNHVALIERWRQMLEELRASISLNYTMFFVAIRELLDLTQTTLQRVEQNEDIIS